MLKDPLKLDIDSVTQRVKSRESEHREFKLIFDNNKIWQYAKIMASFANCDGGVIFFGVRERPRNLVGVTGNQPDEVVIGNFIREYFEPEIAFTLDTKRYNGKDLLYILVNPCPKKPVVCKKERIRREDNEKVLREGAVYYRYSSSSIEIKYPELRQILDDNVQKVFSSLIDNITLVNKVGYDKAAVVDAENLIGDDKKTPVYVTNETAKNINWIRKGQFTESDDKGEKAFYVIREIEVKHGVEIQVPVDFSATHILTKTDLIREVLINDTSIKAVLWKLGLLDNDSFHRSGKHGKNWWHKFTTSARDKILENFPIDMENRRETIKLIYEEYQRNMINQ